MGDNTDNGDAQTEILMVNSDYAHIFNINTLDTFSQHAGNRIDATQYTRSYNRLNTPGDTDDSFNTLLSTSSNISSDSKVCTTPNSANLEMFCVRYVPLIRRQYAGRKNFAQLASYVSE